MRSITWTVATGVVLIAACSTTAEVPEQSTFEVSRSIHAPADVGPAHADR